MIVAWNSTSAARKSSLSPNSRPPRSAINAAVLTSRSLCSRDARWAASAAACGSNAARSSVNARR